MDELNIARYDEHEGTIKIAGSTLPKGAGRCAFHYLQKSIFPIDFMCIGANAGQQATKAMGIFRHMVDNNPDMKGLAVAFQPFLYKTETIDPHTQERKDKSVTIWRTVVFSPQEQKI